MTPLAEAVTTWAVLVVAIIILTLFIVWLVGVVSGAWESFLDHRREKRIINRLRERNRS